MLNLFVAITDQGWFDFLSRRSDLDEVNFWQPGGKSNFAALHPGELFLFKLHSPNDFIAGGGVFFRSEILPVSLAWDTFEQKNGASSLKEMRERIAKYRKNEPDPRSNYKIGCRIITQPFFFERARWIPMPPSWSRYVQQGKKFDVSERDGRYLWDEIQARWQASPMGLREDQAPFGDADTVNRYGEPTLIHPRLGQGAFRIAVTTAYASRCAVTQERTLPALDAAHIRPYSDGGEHEVSNGLLLRKDIHALFDKGYVTVTPECRFDVSGRIREEWENGRDYYKLRGVAISLPLDPQFNPTRAALEWHNSNTFLG